jgi:hypothetical protein
MRINAQSKLTETDVLIAISRTRGFHDQDIWLDEIHTGARGAITFYCESEHGKYSTGRNHPNGARAASWTAWGWLIAELFTYDPDAHIGTYRGRDHFIRCIYSAQRSYILRESLGVTNREGAPGSDCSFLSLFSDEVLSERYNEMR